MRQIYTLRVFALLLMGILSVASALSQSIYSVEPPSKLKANQPYLGFSVSVPLIKVFKPIGWLFKKPTLAREAYTKWKEAELLPPLHLQQVNYPPMFDPWSPTDPGICSTCDKGGGGVPCNGCGGPSGGGGGSVGNPAPADDKYRIPGFRSMDTQINNLCVPSVMAKVLQSLSKKSTSVGDLILDYTRKYEGQGNNILQDGVPLERIIEFVSDYFNLNGGDIEIRGSMADKLKADVLNGTPVMVGINHYSGSGHNVLVTGYNHTKSRFIVLDPETGFESEMSTEQMNAVLYRVPLFCK